MKKHSLILALILALTMALVFVGCKNSTTSAGSEGSEGPEGPEGSSFFDLGALNTSGDNPGWGTANFDHPVTGLTFDTFKASKYLIIEAKSTNDGGFGGVTIAVQGDADSYASTHQYKTGDWSNTPDGNTVDSYFYIIIDLSSLNDGTDWRAATGSSGTKAKFEFWYLPDHIPAASIRKGYLCSTDLTMPAGGKPLDHTSRRTCDGWVSKTVPEMTP